MGGIRVTLSEKSLNILNDYAYIVDEQTHKNKDLDKPKKGKELVLDKNTTVYVVDTKDVDKTGLRISS